MTLPVTAHQTTQMTFPARAPGRRQPERERAQPNEAGLGLYRWSCVTPTPFSKRYLSLGRLGRGSQGTAYLCGDLRRPGRHVVVKLCHDSAQARAALEKEVQALLDLKGAAGVPGLEGLIYRRGCLRGFFTPHSSGKTLEELLAEGRPAPRKAMALALSICEAVLAILSRGFVHRDLKPENILCLDDGTVRILDFGLARKVAEAAERGELSGTLAYASPEQLEGKAIGARSDLFSLGVVLYELLTGEPFFPREPESVSAFIALRRERLRQPVELKGVDPDLAALVRSLIVESPELRAGVEEVSLRLKRMRASGILLN